MRLRTRWRRLGRWRWRIGFVRGEWWVGWRYDFRCDWIAVGLLGLTLAISRAD